MKKIISLIAVIVLLALLFNWQGNDEIAGGDRFANEIEQAQMEKLFTAYEGDGLVSYGYEYYLADIDNDGIDEMLRCYSEGSGFISFCVDCYVQNTDIYSWLEERMMTDYDLYLYKDNLYIISSQSPLSSFFDTPHAYRPALEDNKIVCVEIDDELEQKVLESYEKEHELPIWEQHLQ